MRNIKQNLVFAFAYNALGVPIAAGVLYPAFGMLLSPMIAAAAMSLSSVSVVSNALRSAHVLPWTNASNKRRSPMARYFLVAALVFSFSVPALAAKGRGAHDQCKIVNVAPYYTQTN